MKPEKANLTSDLLAGLTFALVNIPQSMAHALLAAVNPVLGLYTLMVATPVGAVFTSAIFLNVSTSSAISVATGGTLIEYTSASRGTVLVTLVIMIGIFQLILGLFRLGWITRFIPFSVMTGFMTGVAVLIIIGQLGDFTEDGVGEREVRVRGKILDERPGRRIGQGAIAREYRLRPAAAVAVGADEALAFEQRAAGFAALSRRTGELDQSLDRGVVPRADRFHPALTSRRMCETRRRCRPGPAYRSCASCWR